MVGGGHGWDKKQTLVDMRRRRSSSSFVAALSLRFSSSSFRTVSSVICPALALYILMSTPPAKYEKFKLHSVTSASQSNPDVTAATPLQGPTMTVEDENRLNS